MNKKFAMILAALGLAAVLGFTGFGIWHSTKSTPTFDLGGYVLQGEGDEVKWLSFQQGDPYASTLSGTINFTSMDEGKVSVSRESFVHFDNGSMMALSDGILLDFNDLSENFINNYYINAGLRISGSDGAYTAETTMGSMKFGEHLWKLSDQKYMVVAPSLKVHVSDSDVREVKDYVQVAVTDDWVVHLLTPENLWMTISQECYIETEGGVRVYPVTQIIDDGFYKLSLAKLAVSMDDAIVLTEDETRRQIVPELNITTIDGEDGQDGEDGRTGRDGEDGEAGADGENGQNGENGQTGADGETGANGSAGVAGPSGSNGAAGASGANGSDGQNGSNGSAGKDAVVESSTNSALPTMTIKDWQVSATGLKGAVAVTDVGGFLAAIGDMPDYMVGYPGAVTITNVRTGQVISCYETREGYPPILGLEEPVFDFYTGAELVYFSTLDGALEPDTEYKLSVTAYYKAPDETNLIYSREFISRIFYTDSTGVNLAYETATQNSVTLSAAVSDSYQGTVRQATVYLLTPQQNSAFTAASASDANSYTDSYTITNFGGGTVEFLLDGKEGTPLTSNTKYVARVIVTTNSGLTTLTNQALNVMTLKRAPSFSGVPNAYYNRLTGAFEVYRPVVADPDGGAVSYTYTAYCLTDDGRWAAETSRTITPSIGEPVEFRLQPGKMYRFGVEMEFYDNEKTVRYDLGMSEQIMSEGDTMPKITLTPESSGVDYNKYNGTLRIELGGSSAITVDAQHPLKLEFYADQIQSEAVELTSGDPVVAAGRYTITLDTTTRNQNYLDIALELDNLYKNTNYTITVTGYLDVGDGNGPVNRAIGTVSFRTYDTLTLGATWSTPATVSSAFARILSLNVQDSQATAGRSSYAIDELKAGQVTVELFSGTGTGKLRIAQKNFNEPDDLAALFSTGLTITEDQFGGPQLNPDGNYTLTVSVVADESYGMNLGYVNVFEKVLNASEVVAAEPTPPDLLTDPSKGVAASPIYNKDAAKYGGSVDADLPDDAIVGYTLEASYDNVQRIGKTITYYAFEYNTFFNALKDNKDPIQEAVPLMRMTQSIDSGKDSVPKIALLFGGSKTEDSESTIYNGYQVYYAGQPALQNLTLTSGMGRGYRYIFAYTVEYVGSSTGESETLKVYPYGHKEYADYNRYYGGVKENNVQIGAGIAYVLNSGMCEAPLIMPDFHTYVYSSTPDPLGSADALTATGHIVLHYCWRDPDGLVVTDGTAGNTKISYPAQTSSGTDSQNIQKEAVDGSGGWYTIDLPYTISKSGTSVLAPTVNISAYQLNYDTVLTRFNLSEDVTAYPIASIPLDWPWEQQFAATGYANTVQVNMVQNLDENHIDFYLIGVDAVQSALTSRAIAMELEVTAPGAPDKSFLLPLTVGVSGTYARLATGLLGTEYLGKEFTVTASLLYDTGTQGWSIVEQAGADGFALQYTNDSSAPENFGFANYVSASNSGVIPGNGALLRAGSFSAASLRGLVADDAKQDTKLAFVVQNRLTGIDSLRYLYPDRMGVDAHNSSSMDNLSGLYVTPKKVGRYVLNFDSNGSTGMLDRITPTITSPIFHISSSAINADKFSVSGFENGGTIYMAAYDNYTYAQDLNTQMVGGPIALPIEADGTLAAGADATLKGLEGNNKYYIVFYYLNSEGSPVLLLRDDTAEAAIYEVMTSDKAIIDITRLEYQNHSYFEKQLVAEFRISRVFSLSLRYDIYASESDAAADINRVLSYEEMNTEDENDILAVPQVLNYNNNVLTLNLTPSGNRSALKPGVTYYLKISASEENGTDAGSVVKAFTIDAIGNYGALIYVKNATKDSITFQVTINDPQYSLMGRQSSGEGALYAVRFTDADGNLLLTTYDDQVFSANELKREFVLNDDTLLNDTYNYAANRVMQEDTVYRMNIYAVPDADHDGSILLGGAFRSWTDFFDRAAALLQDCGQKFLDFIKSFWKDDLSNNAEQDETEKQLLIAAKSQSTTTEADWLLNEDGVYASRYNSNTVRIIFEESVGLITSTEPIEPVFKQIDWSIEGKANDGSPVSASGTLRRSEGDTLLVADRDAGGYDIYHFDIPYSVGQGTYTIVLQFRTSEDDPAPAKTITIRSGV